MAVPTIRRRRDFRVAVSAGFRARAMSGLIACADSARAQWPGRSTGGVVENRDVCAAMGAASTISSTALHPNRCIRSAQYDRPLPCRQTEAAYQRWSWPAKRIKQKRSKRATQVDTQRRITEGAPFGLVNRSADRHRAEWRRNTPRSPRGRGASAVPCSLF